MDLVEVGKLLAVASAYDNRELRPETAQAWFAALHMQLPDLEFGLAQEIVVWWFSEPREYFTVGALIAEARSRLRLLPHQVEADVRVAKARGLVSPSYPQREPLPADVARRLAELRAGEMRLELEVGR